MFSKNYKHSSKKKKDFRMNAEIFFIGTKAAWKKMGCRFFRTFRACIKCIFIAMLAKACIPPGDTHM